MQLTTLAADLADKPAIIMGGSGATLTFRELEARSNQMARMLRARGLRTGDHIALLFDNTIDMFPIVFAAQRSGLFYTPVNWHLSESEAIYIVENCEARILLSAPAVEDSAAAIGGALPGLERIVTGDVSGVQSLGDAIAGCPADPIEDETEGYYMFYSSGTTGRPKGILPEISGLPFGAGLPIDHRMAAAFGFDRDTVYLSPGPLYHAAPLAWTIGTIRNGGTAVVMEKFDAEQALRLIERHRVTQGQFVPTMFVRMLKLPEAVRARYDVSGLRAVVHSAAQCPVEVKEQMIDWFGPKLVEFYGGTEGTGFCMIDTPTWLTHKGSVGKPLRGIPHICDDDGNELKPGEIGTIWFGDAGQFSYHRDPDKTASAYNDKGWNTLGDLGYVDEQGYLYLSGRRTDLILSGGVNIYPREIEDTLTLHPAVDDVAVIGIPDPEFGQRVHAVVQPAAPATPGPDLAAALIAYCREHLGHYKCPKSVSFEPVPRLPSGKILRRELMKAYENGAKS
ncbi:acyl-CoA synthetase [Nocardia sp. NPDC049526]|uniref:acyl-CoA synthetase n=1 Tax=Nocardia sp. NPDC049526 TaxID=3364316 RepID=UPI003790AEA0